MSDKVIDYGCIGLQSLLTLTQANEVFRIISLILTILSALIVIAKNIYVWYEKAIEDKKISKDEVKDLLDIVDEGIKDLEDNTKKGE